MWYALRVKLKENLEEQHVNTIMYILKGTSKILLIALFYFVGVMFYANEEKAWTIVDSAYFITVTLTTVGYGYYHPTNLNARMFTVFYAMIGIPLILTNGDQLARHTVLLLQDYTLNKLNISPTKKNYYKLLVSIGLVLFVIILGTAIFASLEGWTVDIAFYFTMITIFTIGYGDVEINNNTTKSFSIFFILFCVVTYATAISNIYTAIADLRQSRLRELLLQGIYEQKEITSDPNGKKGLTQQSPPSSNGSGGSASDDDTTPLGQGLARANSSSMGMKTPTSLWGGFMMALSRVSISMSLLFDRFVLNLRHSATTMKQLPTDSPLLPGSRKTSRADNISVSGRVVRTSSGADIELSDQARISKTLAIPNENGEDVAALELLSSWKVMTEERFVLDMLIRLDIIKKDKDIDPWIQFHRQLRKV